MEGERSEREITENKFVAGRRFCLVGKTSFKEQTAKK